MKANEAPEKIYLYQSDREGKEYEDEWMYSPWGEGCVEYIQTDAFFEKAKEWFIEHVNIQQDVATNEDGEPLADGYIKYARARFDAANEMFENFKNYMKGENSTK